ncbi:hypothetical protein PTSG_12789 [Salpingoeca rosetta]|uniref:Uncharacterized protein n=1 Tax=Salpingoeca rosetta (strain ATCC 50818 / BSB-021) TaxID=946362 RepID=F2UKM6_SALR5|nr:uncharacterized protein PTSG_12789 [Salpingoeca rosetta]EGD77675.1 hypothetical protein PTSG_12789 [Salpingoeca rosetta]|eukprot:XP_004990151.1 hypothetical protein PTSG_12789 [Salpingoeca rosetta]
MQQPQQQEGEVASLQATLTERHNAAVEQLQATRPRRTRPHTTTTDLEDDDDDDDGNDDGDDDHNDDGARRTSPGRAEGTRASRRRRAARMRDRGGNGSLFGSEASGSDLTAASAGRDTQTGLRRQGAQASGAATASAVPSRMQRRRMRSQLSTSSASSSTGSVFGNPRSAASSSLGHSTTPQLRPVAGGRGSSGGIKAPTAAAMHSFSIGDSRPRRRRTRGGSGWRTLASRSAQAQGSSTQQQAKPLSQRALASTESFISPVAAADGVEETSFSSRHRRGRQQRRGRDTDADTLLEEDEGEDQDEEHQGDSGGGDGDNAGPSSKPTVHEFLAGLDAHIGLWGDEADAVATTFVPASTRLAPAKALRRRRHDGDRDDRAEEGEEELLHSDEEGEEGGGGGGSAVAPSVHSLLRRVRERWDEVASSRGRARHTDTGGGVDLFPLFSQLYTPGPALVPRAVLQHAVARLASAKRGDGWIAFADSLSSPLASDLYNMLLHSPFDSTLARVRVENAHAHNDEDAVSALDTSAASAEAAGMRRLASGLEVAHVLASPLQGGKYTHAAAQYDTLTLHLHAIDIRFHPLSSDEQVLASQLIALQQRFEALNAPARIPLMHEKLSVLSTNVANAFAYTRDPADVDVLGDVSALHTALSALPKDQAARVRTSLQDVIALETERDFVLREVGRILQNMISLWRDIKALRVSQGFTGTKVDLKFDRVPNSEQEDERLRLQCHRRAVFHATALHILNTLDKRSGASKTSQGAGSRGERPAGEPGGNDRDEQGVDDDDRGGRVQNREQASNASAVAAAREWAGGEADRISERMARSWAPPGQDTLIPVLRFTARIADDDECPQYEVNRRAAATSLKGHVTVYCVDKKVDQVPISNIDGSTMTATLSRTLSLQVLSRRTPVVAIAIHLSAAATTRPVYLGGVYVPATHIGARPLLDASRAQPAEVESHHLSRPGVVVEGHMHDPTFCSATVHYTLSVPSGGSGGNNTGAGGGGDGSARAGAAAQGARQRPSPTAGVPAGITDPNDPRQPTAAGDVGGGGVALQSMLEAQLRQRQLAARHFRLHQSRADTLDLLGSHAPRRSAVDGVTAFGGGDHAQALDTSGPLNESASLVPTIPAVEDPLLARLHSLVHLNKEQFAATLAHLARLHQQRQQQAKDKPRLSDVVSEEALPSFKSLGAAILRFFAQRRPLRPQRVPQRAAARLQPTKLVVFVRLGRMYNVPAFVDAGGAGTGRGGGGGGVLGTSGGGAAGGGGGRRRRARQATMSARMATMTSGDGPSGANINGAAYSITVSLQGTDQTSGIAVGPNPTFNEEMEFAYHPPPQGSKRQSKAVHGVHATGGRPHGNGGGGGGSGSGIASGGAGGDHPTEDSDDHLMMSLFQHVASDSNTPTSRVLVAVFSLPMATLLAQSRIQGTFSFSLPTILHRFDIPGPGADVRFFSIDDEEREIDIHPAPVSTRLDRLKNTQPPCRCSVFLALNPPVRVPNPPPARAFSHEDAAHITFASNLVASFQSKHAGRRFHACANTLTGYKVFLNRFVHPQPLGEDVLPDIPRDDLLARMTARARFVSLLPQADVATHLAGTGQDMWATCEQTLQLGACNAHERAVLLANLLLGLDERLAAWVVLGVSVPDGPTAFVLAQLPVGMRSAGNSRDSDDSGSDDEASSRQQSLTSGSGTLLLWSPSSGQPYACTDTAVPLSCIGTVFNQSNIWLNQQEFDDPARMTFNLDSKPAWLPIFGQHHFSIDLATAKREAVLLPRASAEHARQIDETLEQLLVREVEGWRKRRITRWNQHVARALRTSLSAAEKLVLFNSMTVLGDSLPSLMQVQHAYDVRGFAFTAPLVPVTQLVQRVKLSGVWDFDDAVQQLALAVRTVPYPCNVFASWVYIVTLKPR